MTYLGVLNGQVGHLDLDKAAGFNLVEIEIGWANWEPTLGNIRRAKLRRDLTQRSANSI